MAHISIYCGFCLWSAGFALWCKSISFDLFWRVKLLLRLNKGLTFLQSAFWIWITERFSLVRECNVFSEMLYHAGPSSLGFFAECLKTITDSTLQIQSYKIQVQIKPKLHKLWRIALCLGKFHLSVFLWVFWLERVVPPLVIAFEQQSLECFVIATLRTNRVLRADRKADVNQTSQQSVFSPIGTCIRIWCTVGVVERRSQNNVCLQAFSLFPLPSSLLD